MEISPKSLHPQLLDGLIRFYKLCKDMGLKFSIGDDAHQLVNVGSCDKVKDIIEKVGISDKDIWLP